MSTIDQEYFADNWDTSIEVAEAIFELANNNEAEIYRIWGDPTDEERIAVWERATKNGLLDAQDLFWGVCSLAEIIAPDH